MPDIKTYLKIALEKKASDLHLCSGAFPMLRVDGDLQIIEAVLIENKALQESIKSFIPCEDIAHFSSQLDYDFSFSIEGLGRFRVNCFYQHHGLSLVFRIISDKIPSLDELHAPLILKKLAHLEKGLILITGSTGSGKSTTLSAIVNFINHHMKKHIITLESPIEYIYKNETCLINQRELGRHTKTVEAALSSALREDPDILVIGEMRDAESIRLALTAAETGHLVIASLHTNSAQESIDRLINVFPYQEQDFIRTILALSLQAVISQTLLKKKEGGRIAAYEIMMANSAIRNLIRENKIHHIFSSLQMGQAEGMITREQYIKQLILKGFVLE